VQQIVAEEVPFLFILHLQATTLYSQRIKGLPEAALNGDQLIIKAFQMWIEE
jgi:hypothetical protein